MNGRTARYLKQWCTLYGVSYRQAKTAWQRIPAPAKRNLMERIKQEIRDAHAAKEAGNGTR